MSRSRGRGSKPKRRHQPQPQAKPQPFMMFQVFDEHPWMEVRWNPHGVPPGLDVEAMTTELVEVIRKHMAKTEVERSKSDGVRVSGVPYKIDPNHLRPNGADPIAQADAEHEPESRPDYPY